MNVALSIEVRPRIAALVGDSNMAVLAEYWPGCINAGVSSETTFQMEPRFITQVIPQKPDTAFILGGTNDLMLLQSFSIAGIRSMVMTGRDAGIKMMLCLLPPIAHASYPTTIADVRQFNANILAMAETDGFRDIVDLFNPFLLNGALNPALFTDGVHFAYKKEGREVALRQMRPYQ